MNQLPTPDDGRGIIRRVLLYSVALLVIFWMIPGIFALVDTWRERDSAKKSAPPQAVNQSGVAPTPPNAKALYNQAIDLENKKSYAEAATRFKASGEAGYGRGWYCYGLMAMEGIGLPKDPAMAASAFAKALQAGNDTIIESMWKLAWLYEQGLGVPKDSGFSKQLRDYALSLGSSELNGHMNKDDESLAFLAGLWEEGKTGRQDLIRAADIHGAIGNHEKRLVLLAKAIAEGDEYQKAQAYLSMGRIYRSGNEGLQADQRKAFECFQKSAGFGNSQALVEIFGCYTNGSGTTKNGKEAVASLRKATECKTPAALAWLYLGHQLQNGELVKKDLDEAFQCYERAEAVSPNIAAGELAHCYEYGLGTAPDLVRAGRLYILAHNGNEARSVLLRAMQENRPGAALALAEANISLGRIRSAITVLNDLVAKGDPDALALKGLALAGLSDTPLGDNKVSEPIEPSDSQALPLLLQAAEKGRARAALALYGHIAAPQSVNSKLSPDERSKIEKAIQSAALGGDLECQLAWMKLLIARGDQSSLEKAVGLAESAAKQPAEVIAKARYASVFSELGRAFLNRDGRTADPIKAHKWFQTGARFDDSEAWSGLAQLYENGTAVKADSIRAAYCNFRSRFAKIKSEEEGC